MKMKDGDQLLLLNSLFLVSTLCLPCDLLLTRSPIIVGIQELLDSPNPKSPAQREAIEIYLSDKAEYSRRIKAQALKNVPDS